VTPARTLSLLLVVAGAAAAWHNRAQPDESLWLGLALAVAAVGFALARETPGRARAQTSIAVLVLVLLGGELMVRHENAVSQRAFNDVLVHFVDDPELRYELKPNVACGSTFTNELGMIDVQRAPANPQRAFRVACLGDSVGGDCQLPRTNACAALETLLAAPGRPVEVLNFSVPGYNTMQEARALELKAGPFSPDAVVVLYVLNDPYPDLAISHVLPGRLKFEHLLWSGLRTLIARLFRRSVDPFDGGLQWLHRAPAAWNGVVVNGLDRIRAFADARHIPVVVAVFPVFVDDSSARYGALYRQVADEARRHGFIAVDLLDAAYKDVPIAALLKPSRDLIHPNDRAHRLAAEAIARALPR
jgi:hypothetical protein